MQAEVLPKPIMLAVADTLENPGCLSDHWQDTGGTWQAPPNPGNVRRYYRALSCASRTVSIILAVTR